MSDFILNLHLSDTRFGKIISVDLFCTGISFNNEIQLLPLSYVISKSAVPSNPSHSQVTIKLEFAHTTLLSVLNDNNLIYGAQLFVIAKL